MRGLHDLILNSTFLSFLNFYEKKLFKEKKVRKSCFDKQENPDHI